MKTKNWTNLKYKPTQQHDGSWFVKSQVKKGTEYGWTYSDVKTVTVTLVGADCEKPSVGDKLAHGIVVEVLPFDINDVYADQKVVISQTPEQQAISQASTLNFYHYRSLMQKALYAMHSSDNAESLSDDIYDSNFLTIHSDEMELLNPC